MNLPGLITSSSSGLARAEENVVTTLFFATFVTMLIVVLLFVDFAAGNGGHMMPNLLIYPASAASVLSVCDLALKMCRHLDPEESFYKEPNLWFVAWRHLWSPATGFIFLALAAALLMHVHARLYALFLCAATAWIVLWILSFMPKLVLAARGGGGEPGD